MSHVPDLALPYQPFSYEGAVSPFIVLEGVSGIGKSTLTKLLVKRLGATGIHTLPKPHTDWSKTANARLRPLPQLAFYLSGVLHTSDSIRQTRQMGPVVADRYVSSVIACHAAVHRVGVHHVSQLLEPFLPYLLCPTSTFYLRCSEETLKERLAGKPERTLDDIDLINVPERLERLLDNFTAVADRDPTAVWVDTDGKTAEDLCGWIADRVEKAHA
ncbi:AAA family ATPase [Streptomyces sp. W16]|uniref:AAA family ATPase n=1 Tax=Streptomyces sp. W16 TaxID=3076631 RepID=UPI00295BE860|nr:AAA family ATPase [Streptomyces sp. W16]MDV9169141.1 AAA family ATPase [Streptomyces sp. W16]